GVEVNLDLREKLGQLGVIAPLSGFRAGVADVLFIQAHAAWEQTEWGRVLLLLRKVTTLQPRPLLFWYMAACHMPCSARAPPLYAARRGSWSASPPTNLRIAKVASAKLMSVCANSTT